MLETDDVRDWRSNPELAGLWIGRRCCSKKVEVEEVEGKRLNWAEVERRREIWGWAAGRRGKAADARESVMEREGVRAAGKVTFEQGETGVEG